jgi:hypothetical protein
MNWSIHGAGYASVHRVSFQWYVMNCALAYKWSTDLSLLVTKMTLKALKFTQALEDFDAEWNALKRQRFEAIWNQIRQEMVSTS